MAKAKDAPAAPPAAKPEKPSLPRRCAKCATPATENSFKTPAGKSPYCAPCRQRFPSLATPRRILPVTRSRR